MGPAQISPLLVRLDGFPTPRAPFRLNTFETGQTQRLPFLHDVILPGQWNVAFETTEMLDVKCGVLRETILFDEDQLVAGLAARNSADFRVVAQAVNVVAFRVVEVHQIGQVLIAAFALETRRMPERVVAVDSDDYGIFLKRLLTAMALWMYYRFIGIRWKFRS